MSGYRYRAARAAGDDAAAADAVFDFGAATIGLFGPWGAAFAAGYFVVDVSGSNRAVAGSQPSLGAEGGSGWYGGYGGTGGY